MCGIVFSLRCLPPAEAETGDNSPSSDVAGWDALCELNACRGPDWNCVHTVQLDLPQSSTATAAGSSGGAQRSCPARRIELKFFAAVLHLRGKELTRQPFVNEEGDVFCWNGEVFEGLDIDEEENDGQKLFDALSAAEDPREVFGRIEGPYAFVYYKKRRLYFARDPLGRRSLLVHQTGNDMLLASVGIDKSLQPKELEPTGIYCIDLGRLITHDLRDVLQLLRREVPGARKEWLAPSPINTTVPSPTPPSNIATPDADSDEQAVLDFLDFLEQSVRLRVQHIPRLNRQNPTDSRVAVLFSGGVDCTLLAALAHRCLPEEESIDLLNVAFENPRKLGLAEKETSKAGKKKKGMNRQAEEEAPEDVTAEPEVGKYAVPDRLTGLDAVAELRQVCPGRRWNFVAVNVPYDECLAHQVQVERLMYPSDTIMDLSLANALYFASRGIGLLQPNPSSSYTETESSNTVWQPYTSPARVLLSGLGADEQLAGYSRHRRAFARSSWPGLIQELQTDVDRLPHRNLGRDDRVLSSWGKEVRYPYLSLSFISYLSRVEVSRKCDFETRGEGEGDKMLLRRAAARLGMNRVAGRRKRAMQFGSRSARMGEGDRKGDIKLGDL